MTNVCCVTTFTDEQNGAPVKVELGRTGTGEFHFLFENVLWEPPMGAGDRLQKILQSIAWRLNVAARKQKETKPGRQMLGPFEIGVDADGGFYIRVTPGRFVWPCGTGRCSIEHQCERR